jgi:hypothetical protein
MSSFYVIAISSAAQFAMTYNTFIHNNIRCVLGGDRDSVLVAPVLQPFEKER